MFIYAWMAPNPGNYSLQNFGRTCFCVVNCDKIFEIVLSLFLCIIHLSLWLQRCLLFLSFVTRVLKINCPLAPTSRGVYYSFTLYQECLKPIYHSLCFEVVQPHPPTKNLLTLVLPLPYPTCSNNSCTAVMKYTPVQARSEADVSLTLPEVRNPPPKTLFTLGLPLPYPQPFDTEVFIIPQLCNRGVFVLQRNWPAQCLEVWNPHLKPSLFLAFPYPHIGPFGILFTLACCSLRATARLRRLVQVCIWCSLLK